jgi:uncharacterized protein YndB with AHSA1/START domain
VPTANSTRRIAADQRTVWAVVSDPHHRPRWWPGLSRVEAVTEDRWTEVFITARGRSVRLDFRVVRADEPWRILWEQEVAGTPFARVLAESLTELVLEPDGAGTLVTIAQRQRLRGYSRTGGLLVRRSTARRLDEALAGLERAVAPEG